MPVISLMACYRGGQVGERYGGLEGVGWLGGGWEAGIRLCSLLGPFGLAMSLRSASHRPKHAYTA